ncbi:MAG TPA: cupin domain-containing protein, partial [Thermoanaerobaculia bacterium]
SAGSDGLSILEHHAPFADSPPLHVHRSEDEVFHVLEGELRLHSADGDVRLRTGDIGIALRDVPHTYRVESKEGARWLTITARGDFERFVRAASRPAGSPQLPPAPPGPPTPEQQEALASLARRFDIEIVGPPLM